MKHFSYLFLSIFCFSLQATVSHFDPLLVVVLMVKNEEHVMIPTLQPYVDAGITSYFIFDTGSTDNTIEVTRDFFHTNNITNFYIEQEPFVDFATSRNRALELTEERFPHACFMLMVDAEWYMHNAKGLLEYCKTQIDTSSECYFVRLITKELDYFLPRMMRCRCNVRYRGVVHETIDHVTDGKVPATIWFEVSPTKYGQEKSHKRMLRDKEMLLNYLKNNPDSPRDTFYLAQTFSCLKDWDNAYYYYSLRTHMKGWAEETYMAWYRLGEIAYLRGQETNNLQEWWPKALSHYLTAFALRPWRIEPLVRIAYYYYLQKEYTTAYIFLKTAYDIPYPLYDILFVEKDFYTFYRYDLLSQCALYVGDLDLGHAATDKALEADHTKVHLRQNRAVYFEAKRQKQQNLVNEQYLAPYQNQAPIYDVQLGVSKI